MAEWGKDKRVLKKEGSRGLEAKSYLISSKEASFQMFQIVHRERFVHVCLLICGDSASLSDPIWMSRRISGMLFGRGRCNGLWIWRKRETEETKT